MQTTVFFARGSLLDESDEALPVPKEARGTVGSLVLLRPISELNLLQRRTSLLDSYPISGMPGCPPSADRPSVQAPPEPPHAISNSYWKPLRSTRPLFEHRGLLLISAWPPRERGPHNPSKWPETSPTRNRRKAQSRRLCRASSVSSLWGL